MKDRKNMSMLVVFLLFGLVLGTSLAQGDVQNVLLGHWSHDKVNDWLIPRNTSLDVNLDNNSLLWANLSGYAGDNITWDAVDNHFDVSADGTSKWNDVGGTVLCPKTNGIDVQVNGSSTFLDEVNVTVGDSDKGILFDDYFGFTRFHSDSTMYFDSDAHFYFTGGQINFQAPDISDYIVFSASDNVPIIDTVGACDLKIMGDENLVLEPDGVVQVNKDLDVSGDVTVDENITIYAGNAVDHIRTDNIAFPVFGNIPSLTGSAFGGLLPLFCIENGLYIIGDETASPQLTFYDDSLTGNAYIEFEKARDAFSFKQQTGNTEFNTGINTSAPSFFGDDASVSGDLTVDNINSNSGDTVNITEKLRILNNGADWATPYTFSIQNDASQSYMEIIDGNGEEGVFFGDVSSDFELWNFNGCGEAYGKYPIRFQFGANAGYKFNLESGYANFSDGMNVGVSGGEKLFWSTLDKEAYISGRPQGRMRYNVNVSKEHYFYVGNTKVLEIALDTTIIDNDVNISGDLTVVGVTNSTGGFATDTGSGWSGTYTVTEGVVTVRNGIIIDVDWD